MPKSKTASKSKAESKGTKKAPAAKPVELSLSQAQVRALQAALRYLPAHPEKVTLSIDKARSRVRVTADKREHRIGPEGW